MNYAELQRGLSSPALADAMKALTDIRERIEVLHTAEYGTFLQNLFPLIMSSMNQKTKPQLVDNEENKFRVAVLDIVYRFPTNEVLKPFVEGFLGMVMGVFCEDNEENALTALRIIFDLHKAYRPILEGHAQPFLEQVQRILKNMPNAVKIFFARQMLVPGPSGAPGMMRVQSSGQLAYATTPQQLSMQQQQQQQLPPPSGQHPLTPTANTTVAGMKSPTVQSLQPLLSRQMSGGAQPTGMLPTIPGMNDLTGVQSNMAFLQAPMATLSNQQGSNVPAQTGPMSGVMPSAGLNINTALASLPSGGMMSPSAIANANANAMQLSSNDVMSAMAKGPSAPSVMDLTNSFPSQPLLSQPMPNQDASSMGGAQMFGASSSLTIQLPQNSSAEDTSTSAIAPSPAVEGAEASSALRLQQQPQPIQAPLMTLTRSIDSFKVLTECPLIVMLLFQLYPKFQKFIPSLVPMMMNTLALQAPPSNDPALRARYKEFIAAQVKTLSLLTYLLRNFESRQFNDSARPNEENIAKNVINLLRSCPSDIVSTRKEILVAIRHILNTNDFKKGFYQHADFIMDERLLIGPGRQAALSLRPMAYSTIADLIGHIRESLSLPQLTKLIYSFSQNLFDPDLALNVQMTCAKLLLTIADRLSFNFKDTPELPTNRELIIHLFRSFVNKIGALRRLIPRLDVLYQQSTLDSDNTELGAGDIFVDMLASLKLQLSTGSRKLGKDVSEDLEAANAMELANDQADKLDGDVDIDANPVAPKTDSWLNDSLRKAQQGTVARLGTSTKSPNSCAYSLFLDLNQSADPVRECKQLIRTLMSGVKNILLQLTGGPSSTDPQQAMATAARGNLGGITENEQHLLIKYMKYSLECCFLFKSRAGAKPASGASSSTDDTAGAKKPTESNSVDSDVRELLDQIASTFLVVDPHYLRPVLASNLMLIYDYAVEHHGFLALLQQLYSCPLTTSTTVDTMMTFFMSRIYDLSYQTASSTANTSTGFVTVHGFLESTANEDDFCLYGLKPAQTAVPNYAAATVSSSAFALKLAAGPANNDARDAEKLRIFYGQRASTLLRMFKMLLNAVKTIPDNEKVLRPWLKIIITTCLKCSHECKISVNYLFVLRYLFMTISTGKFEASYSEIFTVFPMLLNSFNRLLLRTNHLIVQNIILELCLTIPSRLTSLHPHLPTLLFLLSKAICTKGELPNWALRTLEFWVEHIKPDVLFSALTAKAGLLRDILAGICQHLKPAPYPYGMLALRVLGKLSGRCRDLLDVQSKQCDVHSAATIDSEDIGFLERIGDALQTPESAYSAVQMCLDQHGFSGASNALLDADAMDVCSPADNTQDENSSNFLFGLDHTVYKACELLDRLCAKSAAIEAEVLSLSYVGTSQTVADSSDSLINLISFESSSKAFLNGEEEILPIFSGTGGQTGDQVDDIASSIHQVLSKEMKYMGSTIGENAKRDALKVIIDAGYAIIRTTAVTANETAVKISISHSLDGVPEQKLGSIRNLLSRIIFTCAVASEEKSLENDIDRFISNILYHLGLTQFCAKNDAKVQSFVCKTVHSAIMTAFEDHRDNVYKGASWLLTSWIKVTSSLHLSGVLPTLSPLRDHVVQGVRSDFETLNVPTPEHVTRDLVDSILRFCRATKQSRRIAGLRAISELCNILPPGWCIDYEVDLLSAIFDILRQCGLALMLSYSLDCASTVKKLLTSCHGSVNTTSDVSQVKSESSPSTKLLDFLAGAAFDICMHVRICAKVSLRHIAAAQKVSVGTLLSNHQAKLYKQHITDAIINLASLSNEEKTGLYAGITYFLGFPELFIEVDEPLLKFMNDSIKTLDETKEKESPPPEFYARFLPPNIPDSIGIADWMDTSLNEWFGLKMICLPNELPTVVELKMAAINLLAAFFEHKSGVLLGPDYFDIRGKCFQVLFKTMITNWDEIKTAAQNTVNVIIVAMKTSKAENILPKQIMNEYLQPLFSTIQDTKRLNVHLLKSLGAILKISQHKFYVQFADKFLEHLKYWQEPEKILNPPVWPIGDEILIAATMMDVFHVLPWALALASDAPNSTGVNPPPPMIKGVLERLVGAVLKLESVRCVSVFTDSTNIANPEVVRLLVAILRHCEKQKGHPFMELISSPEILTTIHKTLLDPLIPQMFLNSDTSSESDEPLAKRLRYAESSAPATSVATPNSGVYSFSASFPAQGQLLVPGSNNASVEAADVNSMGMMAARISTTASGGISGPNLLGGTSMDVASNGGPLLLGGQPSVPPSSVGGMSMGGASPFGLNSVLQANAAGGNTGLQYAGQKRPLTESGSPVLMYDACVGALKLILTLAKSRRGLLNNNPSLMLSIRSLWFIMMQRRVDARDERLYAAGVKNPQGGESFINFHFSCAVHQIMNSLAKCLMLHFDTNPTQVSILFDLVPALCSPSTIDFTFLSDFLSYDMPKRYSSQTKRSIIKMFVDILGESTYTLDAKIKCWKVIITPLFLQIFQSGSVASNQVFDAEILDIIYHRLYDFGSLPSSSAALSSGDEAAVKTESGSAETKTEAAPAVSPLSQLFASSEALRVESIKLVALMVEHLPQQMSPYKKEIVRFAWLHIKSDDLMSKHWANVLICRFIACYAVPFKIVFQAFTPLLRAYQNESKDLVRLAMDILAPVLTERTRTEDLIRLMRIAKKTVLEDGHSIPQLIHIWHIVIRHADTFYPFRGYFISLMIQSVARLGLTGSCPLDQRQVAVGIADVIVEWEWFRQQQQQLRSMQATSSGEDSNNKVTASSASTMPSVPTTGDAEYALHHSLVPVLANFLVRLALFAAEGKDIGMHKISTRCLLIFKKMAKLMSMKHVKMAYFDRYFQTTVENLKPKNSALGPPHLAALSGPVASTSGANNSANKAGGNGGQVNSSAPQANASQIVSDKSIETFISLLQCGLDCFDGPSPLFLQNLGPLKDLILVLTASNDFAKSQKVFKDLIVSTVSIFPPSTPTHAIVESGLYNKFRDHIEKLIRKFAGSKVDLFSASPIPGDGSEDTSNQINSSANSQQPQKAALLASLLNILRLLDAVCAKVPSWIKNHGSAMIRLSHKLIGDHIETASNNLRSGIVAMAFSLQEHGQSIETSKIQPTPQMALLSENLRNVSSSNTQNAGTHSVSPSATLAAPDDATLVLLCCMNILFRSFSRMQLEDQSDVIVNLAMSILESSDNSYLLALTVDYLNLWIGRANSPLSLKLQCDIANRIDNLDRLYEIQSQPLLTRLIAMNERLASYLSKMKFLSTDVPGSKGTIGTHASTAAALNIRPVDFLGLLCLHEGVRNICCERLSSTWGQTLFTRMVGILRADHKLLANRFWPAVLPSVLSGCSDIKVSCVASKKGKISKKNTAAMTLAEDHPYRSFVSGADSTEDGLFGRFMTCVGSLSLICVEIGDVWKIIYRAFWSQASNNDRILLTHAFCENVARHHYRQNLYWPSKLYGAATGNETFQFQGGNPTASFSNVPQSLLSVFMSLYPRPVLSVEFLGAMSSMYSTWHVSSAALESIIFSDSTSPLVKQRALRAVLAIHSDVGDSDSYKILSRLFCEKPATDLALSLDAFSLHQESQCVLMKAVSDIQNTTQQNQVVQMNSFEMETLEHEWVESCRRLSQWDILYGYAEALHLSQVSIEAAAIRGDWENVRRLRVTPSVVASLEMGLPSFKLYDVMMSIRENKFAEADRICALIVQMTLFRWKNMPIITAGCSVHRDLMNVFHRVIEMRESTGMIMEVLKQSQKDRSHDFPDLKGILETWRDRLPDVRDDMSVWDATMLWRTNVFQIIQSSVRNVQDASQLASLHDTPWTVVKLAKAATKRKLPDVALLNLSKLDSISTMDVTDCFTKLREQIVVCLSSEKELSGGLNIINSTNLEFFDWPQKAELFRLKGIFLERLGQITAAEQAFSQSVQMCPANAKSWFSWGCFFYKVYLKERTAANAISCMVPIMKAVEYGLAKARPYLARVIEFLAVESDSSVGTAFQSVAPGVPEWAWLSFLPHLFDCLQRRESAIVKPLLMRIAEKYPQAVFNLAYYFATETKDVTEDSRASIAIEILESINRVFPTLSKKLSTLHKNISALAPTSLETIQSIFVKFLASLVDNESLTLSSDAASSRTLFSLSQQLNAALSRDDYISTSESKFLSKTTEEIFREAKALKDSIASEFSWLLSLRDEKAIGDAISSKRQTIPNARKIAELAANWIEKLNNFLATTLSDIPLFEISPALFATFVENNIMIRSSAGANSSLTTAAANTAPFAPQVFSSSMECEDVPDVPGAFQTCWTGSSEPALSMNPKIVRFLPSAKLVCQNGGSWCRRISMIASDGDVYHFNVVHVEETSISSMLAVSSLNFWLNSFLKSSSEAYRRDLMMKIPAVVPISRGVCLVQVFGDTFAASEPMISGSESMYSSWINFKLRSEAEMGSDTSAASRVTAKRAALKEINESCSTGAVRARIASLYPSHEHYYSRSKSLAGSLGLHGAVSVLLGSPTFGQAENMLLSSREGSVQFCGDFKLSETGLEATKLSNIRLSSSITNIFSPVLMLGTFSTSMGCMLDCMVEHRDEIESLLYLSLIGAGVSDYEAKTRVARALDRVASLAPRSQDLSAVVRDIDSLLAQQRSGTSGRITEAHQRSTPPPVDAPLQRLIASLSSIDGMAENQVSSMPWF